MSLMGAVLETFSPRRSAEVAGQVHRTLWCVGRLAGAPLPSQCLQQSQANKHTECAMEGTTCQMCRCNFQYQPFTKHEIPHCCISTQCCSHLMKHATQQSSEEHLPQLIKAPCCGAWLPCLPLVRAT